MTNLLARSVLFFSIALVLGVATGARWSSPKPAVGKFSQRNDPSAECVLKGEWVFVLRNYPMRGLASNDDGIRTPVNMQGDLPGTVTFDESAVSSGRTEQTCYDDPEIGIAFGRFTLEAPDSLEASMYCGRNSEIVPAIPDSVWNNICTEVMGGIGDNDVISLSFVPALDHGAVNASGTIVGDTISGSWWLRTFAGSTPGQPFSMWRRP